MGAYLLSDGGATRFDTDRLTGWRVAAAFEQPRFTIFKFVSSLISIGLIDSPVYGTTAANSL